MMRKECRRTYFAVFYAVSSVIALGIPVRVSAQVAGIVFTSDSVSAAPSVRSAQITLQTQDAAGIVYKLAQTGCVSLATDSPGGAFYSSATSQTPAPILSMSKNTSTKNFFYQDTVVGTHHLTAIFALKPDTESRACTVWPVSEWGTTIQASQVVTIGSQTVTTTQGETTETQTQSPSVSAATPALPPVSSYVPPPMPTLFADAGTDRVVVVGADSVFAGRAYTRTQEVVTDHVRYVWNFGDGSIAEGERVLHHYAYPGRYMVVLDVAHDKTPATHRIVVTAEPARLGFESLPDGGVGITNGSGRDLDLSHWVVRTSGNPFMIPEESIILAGEVMRIPAAVLGVRSTAQTELAYPNGVLAVRTGTTVGNTEQPQAAVPVVTAVVVAPTPKTIVPPIPQTSRVPVSEDDAEASLVHESNSEVPESGISTSTSQVAAAGVLPVDSPFLWSALGVGALASGAAYITRRLTKREWVIEDALDTV